MEQGWQTRGGNALRGCENLQALAVEPWQVWLERCCCEWGNAEGEETLWEALQK